MNSLEKVVKNTYNYISLLLVNMIKNNNEKTRPSKNILNIKILQIPEYDLFSVVHSEEKRIELINNGIESAKDYLFLSKIIGKDDSL
jgi:hypothetical protein